MTGIQTFDRPPQRLATLAQQLGQTNGTAPVLICDPDEATEFERKREASGLDKYDEVWEGVAVIMSLPNNLHQELVQLLCFVIQTIYGLLSPHKIRPGVNVSDRVEGWKQNYREPDVAVFLESNPAIDCGTHWFGGPDFLVEIVSPGDPTREKLPFYSQVNTREVLIIDRKPWRLELHRLTDGKMIEVGSSSVDQPNVLTSVVLPVTFRLVAGPIRPQIEIVHTATGQTWLV